MTDKETIAAAIESHIASGETFTLSDLVSIALRYSGDCDADRLADAAIQRWRKKGWISFSRAGRRTVWSLTDAGRLALKPAPDREITHA